ncbi:hypothetical protein AwDysgo_13020 [Bacteroidales bacterium]|nr:hypothetical protein AwDysgo_13020 [Bacteroidales bacterium]
MDEKIIALLTVLFSGMRKDGLNQLARTLALQVATEDEAKALVDKLTEAQVNKFIKDYRSEVDKEVSESKKTLESNLKKKFDFVEKKDPETKEVMPNPKDGGATDIAAAVQAALAAELTPLRQELAGFKSSEISKSRLHSLTEKLSACKDETFKAKAMKDFGRMKFETDDEFNEYLTETDTDITTANQHTADTALGGQGKPLFAQKSETGISQGVAEYVASQKPDAQSVLSGKEI